MTLSDWNRRSLSADDDEDRRDERLLRSDDGVEGVEGVDGVEGVVGVEDGEEGVDGVEGVAGEYRCRTGSGGAANRDDASTNVSKSSFVHP